MLGADRDALLCDLAETYQIYDLKALPVTTLAVLSFGLRPDSRIKMKLAGRTYVSPLDLQAHIADTLTLIHYHLFSGKDDPVPRLYTDIINGAADSDGEIEGYESGEAFDEAWNREVRRLTYGG